MNRRETNSVSIPNDLIVEIFSRLPANSVARCRCLSKLWESILYRPYFTELFLTRSCTRPRLLFALKRTSEWSFYSSLQPHNPSDRSWPLLGANSAFHMKLPEDMRPEFFGFIYGLIYLRISLKSDVTVHVLCNPRTGQYVTLPKLIGYGEWYSFLGFDPIGKQFKVLLMSYPFCADDHRIVTLGNGIMKWRKIICPLSHEALVIGICINGVVYYLAKQTDVPSDLKIACFDVRSEKFKFIDAEWNCHWSVQLVNFKGKVGLISWKAYVPSDELRISVLEDVEKQEWSKYVYTLPEKKMVDSSMFSIIGVTATGEIVFSMTFTSGQFYVFYFSLERNTLQHVEIQGLENDSRVYACLDLVEDLNVNDAKYLKSSPRLNVIRNKPKPEIRGESSVLCNSAPSVKTIQSTIPLQNKYDVLANLD